MKTARNKSLGFSLIELMVVVAIATILIGVVMPVLAKAKTAARKTDDLVRMKQIGLAATLYRDDYDGEITRGIDVLVESGRLEKYMASLTADPTSKGIGNIVASQTDLFMGIGGDLTLPYKNSTIGLREYRIGENADRFLLEGPAGGWLLDFTQMTKQNSEDYIDSTGTYRRLCFDTSVVTRKPRMSDCGLGECRMLVTFFVDDHQEFTEWIKQL
ncbi:MAG: type II secretion system protein [Fimbriimonadaceae bacterium]|nr:type II secretion system protein [Fimbriimonadaceae bacterium]